MTVAAQSITLAPPRRPWLALAGQIVLVFTLLLVILWEPWRFVSLPHLARSLLRGSLIALTAIVVGCALLRPDQSLESLGLRPRQWLRGLPAITAWTAVGLALIVATAAIIRPPLKTNLTLAWLGQYVTGVVAQQFLLQAFLTGRLDALASPPLPYRRAAVILGAAILFALLHAPNPGLMAFAAIAGCMWCRLFLRYRNLLGVVLSHLVLGIAAIILLGNGPLMGLRVGYPALRRLLGH